MKYGKIMVESNETDAFLAMEQVRKDFADIEASRVDVLHAGFSVYPIMMDGEPIPYDEEFERFMASGPEGIDEIINYQAMNDKLEDYARHYAEQKRGQAR